MLLQRLRSQLDTKRPIIEQSLEAGRFYLREEGDDTRLSTSSNDSNDQGKLNSQSMIYQSLEAGDNRLSTSSNVSNDQGKSHSQSMIRV